MTVIGAYKAMGPEAVMQYIGGALILGGILLSVVGYSGIVGYVRKVITPVVIGPVIMAIGFSLAPVAIQGNAANYWPASLAVVLLIFLFSLVSSCLADLCLIDLHQPVFSPNHHFVSNLVYAANGSCVDTVICDGRIVMRDRKVPGEDEIMEHTAALAYDLMKRER